MNGVKYYVLVDTDNKKVECYELMNGLYQAKKDITFMLAAGYEIEIDFAALWD